MEWTLKEMVNGLFFCATLTGRRGSHTTFAQAGAKMLNTGAEAVRQTQALLGRVTPGGVLASGMKM